MNGSAIPDVDFDVGESYAGSIPVTTEEAGDYLFYWFFPSTNVDADKEILIWLNGGVRSLTVSFTRHKAHPLTAFSSPAAPRSRAYSKRTVPSCGNTVPLNPSKILGHGTNSPTFSGWNNLSARGFRKVM